MGKNLKRLFKNPIVNPLRLGQDISKGPLAGMGNILTGGLLKNALNPLENLSKLATWPVGTATAGIGDQLKNPARFVTPHIDNLLKIPAEIGNQLKNPGKFIGEALEAPFAFASDALGAPLELAKDLVDVPSSVAKAAATLLTGGPGVAALAPALGGIEELLGGKLKNKIGRVLPSTRRY